jgi:hypothetical protein
MVVIYIISFLEIVGKAFRTYVPLKWDKLRCHEGSKFSETYVKI